MSATPPEGVFRANPLVMHGTVQGDRLFSERDPRTFKGMGGDDTIIGSWGDNQAFGCPGADRLNMGHGHDLAYGGAHSDTLMGGTG